MRPDGDGGWSRHWLPKMEGTHAVGRTGGTLRPRPGALKRNVVVVKILPVMKIAEKLIDLPAVGVLITGKYISDRNSN